MAKRIRKITQDSHYVVSRRDVLWSYEPLNTKELENLTEEYLRWSEGDNALVASEFPNMKNMSLPTFYRYADDYPPLKEACHIVRIRLARRRETGALTNKLNASIVCKTMGLYDIEYKAFMEWEANLNKKEEQRPATVNVILEGIPNSQIVPKKE